MVTGLIKNELKGEKSSVARSARRTASCDDERIQSESPKLLACLVNLDKGKIHMLTEEELSIGRSSACDILINTDATVSRRHAVVRMIDSEFYLEDLGSRNGTSVNGELVKATKVKLSPDDQIHIGKTVYVFSPVGISEALYGSSKELGLNENSLSPACARKIFTGLFDRIFNKGLKLPRLTFISDTDTIQSKVLPTRK